MSSSRGAPHSAWGTLRSRPGRAMSWRSADPAETRGYRALEPGTRIVCFGAGPGAEDDYGAWIGRRCQNGSQAAGRVRLCRSASHDA